MASYNEVLRLGTDVFSNALVTTTAGNAATLPQPTLADGMPDAVIGVGCFKIKLANDGYSPTTHKAKDLPPQHGKREGHRYACTCGKTFSRSDSLKRHITSKSADIPKYPCEHCDKHRGERGFRRLDHLFQHHNHCPGKTAVDAFTQPGTASGQAAATSTAVVISEVPAPETSALSYGCPEPGCPKEHPDGFVYKEDFDNHLTRDHGYVIRYTRSASLQLYAVLAPSGQPEARFWYDTEKQTFVPAEIRY
ncbi:hypothetical protein GGS23DRAFT_596455 [Durotheca rogersii]|uniref:uncharacterized protein n=1 Tax=Durotheca rogersii TaxID=419775 RepID=UPI00221E6094|nr:uncharacterized protein GGS23DRAFT_596455 [Durotheca rogersii]KAI5863971.1 hypothetical protein GGS23DRAFT_596455 [Durotheca rogersii]